MSERLVVDSIMTADGEVVPLGPVDKDGHRVPLDTTSLYGPRGEHYKVKSFVHFPLMDGWFMECAFTHDLIDVSSLRLKAPDSWEKLLEDLNEGANHSEYSSCFYFRKAECDCSSCKADRYSNCDQPVFKDIASRIRRLRGEVREDA